MLKSENASHNFETNEYLRRHYTVKKFKFIIECKYEEGNYSNMVWLTALSSVKINLVLWILENVSLIQTVAAMCKIKRLKEWVTG